MIRYQRNVTLSKEHQTYVREIYGKKDIKEIAKDIGVGYRKTLINLKIMGLHKPTPYKGLIVKMDGYFDIERFAKHYNF